MTRVRLINLAFIIWISILDFVAPVYPAIVYASFAVLFSTPLEEFEEALIKAERAKSLDVDDWLPQMDVFDDDAFRKSLDEDVENYPTVSYVQTRRPQKTHVRLVSVLTCVRCIKDGLYLVLI